MSPYLRASAIALCLITLPCISAGQSNPAQTPTPKPVKKTGPARETVDPRAAERRTVVIQLATSLADEAAGYHNQQLRARVQMRVAEALWETNQEKARELFRKSWDTAEAVDKESERQYLEGLRANSTSPSRVREPTELRGSVLRLVARRDKALGEEFLAKLNDARDQRAQTVTTGPEAPPAPPAPDPESPPREVAERLRLARQLLEEGDTARALQFADKALDIVTTKAMMFLSALREKDQAAADQRFAAMLQRAGQDPTSDAVTVSVLSSYAFTPFLTVVVRGNGRNHSSAERSPIVPPNISPALRNSFLRTGAQILLRPIPPVEQDRTLAGRSGLFFTVARLLPLYEQHAVDLAPALRAQLGIVATDSDGRPRNTRDRMLTMGLIPEESMADEGREAIESADRAANQADRDAAFARAAQVAGHKGDIAARELADKIEDSDMRKRVRAYVDFSLVNNAIEKKNAEDALRLVRSGELTSVHKVWALTEVVKMTNKTDAKLAEEILDEAATEARRIGSTDADRARALFGVATRMHDVDKARVWEIASEAIKSANSAEEFTGVGAQIVARLSTPRGTSTSNFSVESFDLDQIFGLLAVDDLYRAIQLAKNFNDEAPRATATLAIVRAMLDRKKQVTRTESEVLAN